ncbi:sensor histidine kinase [Sphingomonas abietis]|uniref:histidine kinase n=1 Tax=Sphingomonas abietis TaxID=3012344 RepID=A0ABY7NMW3_9SPHN|nr:ATP-binding protein [Sphingomonas abietis]WBO21826.1 ATP-binding protein [Sphingomonas abietis]
MTDIADYPAPMIEAMELALGRLDVREGHAVIAKLAEPGLSGARRENLQRQLLTTVKLVMGNPRALGILGVEPQALPVALSGIWPFAQADQLRCAIEDTLGTAGKFRTTLNLQAPDGRAIHATFVAWTEADGRDAISFGLLDITEQICVQDSLLRLQAEMAHSDRLSTLGVMTATIAHEVRQPLAAMMTSAEAGLRWLHKTPPELRQVEDCLETIVLGATKANETVAKLRAMASNRGQAREVCDVKVLIEETAGFLRQELASRHATLSLDIAADLPTVIADGVQVRQVLTNLMVNAAQAMADAQCWSRALKVRARGDETFVIIEVEDSGPGIASADRERLFDGFFTTKATGLGLGLRICRAIIVDHGGTLDHLSKASAGSIFRFTLPIQDIVDGTHQET